MGLSFFGVLWFAQRRFRTHHASEEEEGEEEGGSSEEEEASDGDEHEHAEEDHEESRVRTSPPPLYPLSSVFAFPWVTSLAPSRPRYVLVWGIFWWFSVDATLTDTERVAGGLLALFTLFALDQRWSLRIGDMPPAVAALYVFSDVMYCAFMWWTCWNRGGRYCVAPVALSLPLCFALLLALLAFVVRPCAQGTPARRQHERHSVYGRYSLLRWCFCYVCLPPGVCVCALVIILVALRPLSTDTK
jgi:hypothetical protein